MKDIPLPEFARRISELIPEIMKRFTQRHSSELLKGKITLPQFLILNFLSDNQDCRMTDLANFLKVSTAAATGIIERMVRAGYVKRLYDPLDRRTVRIRITVKSQELLKNINESRQKMIVDIFGKLSEQERQDYLRILTRIHQALVDDRQENP